MLDILNSVKSFLKEKLNKNDKVLLALSGGSDSSCLFDILYKLKDELNFHLHVANIDHSFRKESANESHSLKNLMNEKNISFHFKKLNIEKKSNIEEQFRNERYLFFKETCKKINCNILITAHHKADLLETVLKRVLEGSNLHNIYSMTKDLKIDEMTILRPFLDISKKNILDYLKINHISYFKDYTNEDTYYLRARFRKKIVPFLEENFQKNIFDSIYSISKYSYELNDYLFRKLQNQIESLKSFFLGHYINLDDINEPLEIRYILNSISKRLKLNLSREHVQNLIEAILNKKTNYKIIFKNFSLIVDRSYLFIIDKTFENFFEDIPLREGRYKTSNFLIDIKKVNNKSKNSSWRDLLKKSSKIYIPSNNGIIKNLTYNKSIKKRFENYKVPAFLRRLFPVICIKDIEVYDFLTSKEFRSQSDKFFEVSLKIIK
ncbi:MAG: tRNA(Ile)-lysidine synthase [Candidatus Anoxychlamydiales bacterium]|nr:tRNA(Ile)-lysidine synthase [Candidatus Anoxychlamydiales bacterium]